LARQLDHVRGQRRFAVRRLGKATVNLRIYFWLNGSDHSWLKVRSSVIRLIKRAFQENGISLPDEAREVVFPQGVPVHMVQSEQTPSLRSPESPNVGEASSVSTHAESGLGSEAPQIEDQARRARDPEGGENLLIPT